MKSVFFSATLGPGSEQRVELVERRMEMNSAPLRIDVHYYDPTLTIFQEFDHAASQGTGQKEDRAEYQDGNPSGQAPQPGNSHSNVGSTEDE